VEVNLNDLANPPFTTRSGTRYSTGPQVTVPIPLNSPRKRLPWPTGPSVSFSTPESGKPNE